MKVRSIRKYVCEVCNEEYNTRKEAVSCESKKVSQNKKVKIGDTVLITGGEGQGRKAIVTRIGVCSKYWGHYAWERYWHTVFVSGDLVDGGGSRLLVYDSYEKA